MTTDGVKTCTRCGESKPLSEFGYEIKKKGTLKSRCRQCVSVLNAEYRASKGEEILVKKRAYYHNTRPARRAKAAEYLSDPDHRKRNLERHAAWYLENKEHVLQKVTEWVAENPEASRAIKKRHKDKKRSTPQGRLESNIRRGVVRGLAPGAKANTPTFSILPYTPSELCEHLESMFSDGMSWENYGYRGWHIDHVRPLASFTYETPSDPEFREAWALSNLQPLWWRDNMSKNAKWTPPIAANDNGKAESSNARSTG